MSRRCDESAAVDAWAGARIGHRTRLAQQEAARRRIAEEDVGPPGIPRVTMALLLVTVFWTLVEFQRFGASPTAYDDPSFGALSTFALARGDWWVLLTSNLLHANVSHLLMNVFVIAIAGRWVELIGGRWVTGATVGASALLASVGAIAFAPTTYTVGASGIGFGLLGCVLVLDRRARTTAGGTARALVVINVVVTFLIPNISVGGHLGGLVGGIVVGLVCWSGTPRSDGAGVVATLGSPRIGAARAVCAVTAFLLVACVAWPQVDAASATAVGRDVATWLVDIGS